MGTKGYIAKQIGPDAFLTIYSHIDNYPEVGGKLLLEHYKDPERVDKLLALGDIWCVSKELYPNPTKQHDLYQRQKDVVYAYGRDGGDVESKAAVMTLDELDDIDSMIQFVYVFTPENEWKYFAPGQAHLGFRDIQADLDNPSNIPVREHPLFEALQEEILGKLGQAPPESEEGPEEGLAMKMT